MFGYTPPPGSSGLNVIKDALRAYLQADLSAYQLPSVVERLPEGAAGIMDEGLFREDHQTPVVLVSTLGDGIRAGAAYQVLIRFILYVVDRGRGLYTIEDVLQRIRMRFNFEPAVTAFFTFPPSTPIRIDHLEVVGSTTSVSLAQWKAEARGLYLFVYASGFTRWT